MKKFVEFVRTFNPWFVLLFPILVLPSMLYYMVRPWILMDDLVERNIFMWVPIFNEETQKRNAEEMAAKKIADQKAFDERSAEIERQEAQWQEKERQGMQHKP